MSEARANPYALDRPELDAAPAWEIPGLAEFEWGLYADAYASEDTPRFLAALTSPERADRDWAVEALYASVNHQGTPSSVSPHVVPFMLSLLDWEGLAEPEVILLFLAELAVGDSRWSLEAGTEIERFHRSACYDAVCAGAERYAALRTHERYEVRAAAHYACAFVHACDAFAPPEDEDEVFGVRLMARIARALRARRLGEPLHEVRAWAEDEERWTRTAGLIALGYAHPELATPTHLAEARKIIKGLPSRFDPPAPDVPDGFPWDAHTTLSNMVITVAAPKDLDARIDRIKPDDVGIYCARRAFEAIGADHTDGPVPFDALDPRMQRVLRALAESQRLLGAMVYQEGLRYLPTSLAPLRRYVGLDHGPLDAVVDGEPLWLSLFRAARHGDPWIASEQVPMSDRLLVVEDGIANLPWVSDMAGFRRDWDARRRVESAAIIALARFAYTVPEAPRWAEAALDEIDEHKDAPEALLFGLVVAYAARARGEHFDRVALLGLDRPPARVFSSAVAELASHLSPDAQADFINAIGLVRRSVSAFEERDDDGEIIERVEEVSLYFPRQWWMVLGALGGPVAARRVLDAADEAMKLRANRQASHPRLAPNDSPFPVDAARDVFEELLRQVAEGD